MGNSLQDETNEILNAVRAPERKKKQPTNFALWAAILFANTVFLLLDAISGWTVWTMTGFWMYGVLTFLAGYVPLLLHEFLFKRAFASELQKNIAAVGAITSILSIFVVGVMAGYINVAGVEVDRHGAELTTIIILIMIAAFHAIMATVYFYVDEGIRNDQQVAQAVARAIRQGELLKAGDHILTLAQKSVLARKSLAGTHSKPALSEVLRQLGLDEDGNGVPDFLERKGQPSQVANTQQYASSVDANTSLRPVERSDRPN